MLVFMAWISSLKVIFLPKPNLTEKMEFVSKAVQIVEPETFGLLN